MRSIKQDILIKNVLFVISAISYIALSIPATNMGLKIGIVIALICYTVTRFTPNILDLLRENFYKSYLIMSIVLSCILGLRFKKVWINSIQFKMISERIGINTNILLYTIGITGGILAIYFCLVILTFCLEYPKKMLIKINERSLGGKNIVYDKYFIIGIVIILFLQSILLIYWGNQKQGYHVDEVYTFELSNYTYTNYGDTENSYAHWNNGDRYLDVVEPNGTELFNYTIPYWNSETDNHPMIYYSIIHTISSIFVILNIGINKWVGLIPNIIFCLGTTFILILLFYKLTKKKSFSLIASGVWAFSIGAINTGVYIRMYALLTFFCILFTYMHYIFYESIENRSINKKILLWLQITTVIGILSQYYFLIFAFLLCGLTVIILFIKRQWNILKCYIVTEFNSVIIAILLFPRMIFRLFFGDRGSEALNNLTKSGSYINDLYSVYEIINKELFNGSAFIIFIIAILCVIFACMYNSFNRNKLIIDNKNIFNNIPNTFILQMIIVVILFICTITKIVPYKVDRYYMCIFPILITCIVYIILNSLYSILSKFKKGQTILSILALCIVCISILMGYSAQKVDYIYKDYEERRQIIYQYKELPVIVLNKDYYNDSSLKWIFELLEYKYVFLCRNNNFNDLKIASKNKNLQKGFLVYAHMYTKKDNDTIISKIKQNINVDKCEFLTDIGDCSVYYCTAD